MKDALPEPASDGSPPSPQRRPGRSARPPELPHQVTLLGIPVHGTSWYHRGVHYWTTRLLLVLLMAAVVTLYVLLYKLILWDSPAQVGHFGAVFWGILAFGAVATAEGVRLSVRADGLEFALHAASLPVLVYVVCVFLLAPGVYLGLVVDGLSPRTRHERIAWADLQRQLAERRWEAGAGEGERAR